MRTFDSATERDNSSLSFSFSLSPSHFRVLSHPRSFLPSFLRRVAASVCPGPNPYSEPTFDSYTLACVCIYVRQRAHQEEEDARRDAAATEALRDGGCEDTRQLRGRSSPLPSLPPPAPRSTSADAVGKRVYRSVSYRLLSSPYPPVMVSHPTVVFVPLNVRYHKTRRPNHSRLSCHNPRVSLAMSDIAAFQASRRKECSPGQRTTFTRSRGSPRSAFTRTLVAADNLEAKLGNSEFTE